MHLGEPKSAALFNPHAAVRDFGVILLAIALTLVSAAVVLDMLCHVLPGEILSKKPTTTHSFTSHLLCLLAALPGAATLVAALRRSVRLDLSTLGNSHAPRAARGSEW